VSSVLLAHYRSINTSFITKTRNNSIKKINNILGYISDHTKQMATKLERIKTLMLPTLEEGRTCPSFLQICPIPNLLPTYLHFRPS